MKKLLSCFLLLSTLALHAQVYNNEWIDHTKTYYKFKVGKTGLYRIPQAVLATAGMGNAPAEHFQLWRNGVEVPIYTSVVTGTLTASDFIEFWGLMNDGKPDKALYRNPDFQLNDKWSLQTDTATYFLTVNPTGTNRRLVTTANNVAGNTLPAEPYFMHTVGNYFRDRMNGGYAINVGQLLFSSSYDRGEGWTSPEITTGNSNNATFNNLYVASSGPDAKLKIAVSGNALYPRFVRVRVNGDSVLRFPLDFYNYKTDSATFSSSKLATNAAAIQVTNICNLDSCVTIDRMVIHKYELTYPRQFNFDNATNFEFSMPASINGNYLEIAGFNTASVAPVLYDLTNGKRYVGDISTAGIVKIVLEPSTIARQLVLVGQQAGNVTAINALQSRQFVNYASLSNQANYLIVSNQRLFSGANGTNPVEEYRAYRSSNTGGAFTAKIFEVDELTDQFGFGVKKHPVAIRNFILYARHTFTEKPKHLFIIGKGVNYMSYRANENQPNIEDLNLIPTYGVPASDALLTAEPGSSLPQLSYGRLSAISAAEVATYLKKVKESEAAQANITPNRVDREWMKNVVHINGISEPDLKQDINRHYNKYKAIIEDTLFGAKVYTFSKTSTDAVEQISTSIVPRLFKEGISLITYFGHSSSNTLEFNLERPEAYENQGKYPLFIALGCYIGDFFNYNTKRLVDKETLSERYTLAPDRGTIGFVASTHYGIVHYLDLWNTQAYRAMSRTHYGSSMGEILKVTAKAVFDITSQEDFYARSNVEQTELNGDPALKVNPHAKPDYVIEESFIKVSPDFISIAETFVSVKARVINIGKAIADSIVIEVKRQYPNNLSEVVFRKKIPGIRYADSVSFNLPIEALRDKGINKLIFTVDADNDVDEFFETNNTISKDIIIYEDEIRPVYPYNFSIINKQDIKLVASTANAFSPSNEYKLEIDTTEFFNSPLKVSKTIKSIGGAVEFEPGITYLNNTVYYWRVAQNVTSGDMSWRGSSFIYLANHEPGFNQSHVHQHNKSEYQNVFIDEARKFGFTEKLNDVFVSNGVFPTAASTASELSISINNDAYIRSVCGISNIIVNVIEPKTFKPWINARVGEPSRYGSDPTCGNERMYNFQFNILDNQKRASLVSFLDLIPSDHYVIIRNTSGTEFNSNTYANDWKKDTSFLGSNNSIYHRLYENGFTSIDSFDRPRSFIFMYKKNDKISFVPKFVISNGINDRITLSADAKSKNSTGSIISPLFGRANKWGTLQWRGESVENISTDVYSLDLIGVSDNGQESVLYENINTDNLDISNIDASKAPYVKLKLNVKDSVNFTPYHLEFWRLTYEPVPEGALVPNLFFVMKDTVELGEPLELKVAFKNISETAFDSVKVKLTVIDKNNVSHVLQNYRYKPLTPTDTLTIVQQFETKQFVGLNSLFLDVNPDNDQPEQHHFNNIAYRNFFVVQDTLNPIMDVTFDNVHILNNDIISPKPDILIKLKDEAKWNLLNDTSLVNIRVKYPDGTIHPYHFNTNDTLRFTSAQSSNDNTATINFKPYFSQDGTYELMVSGKDRSDNNAGILDYRVTFEVYNKAMISNLLNYPNPFTTATAFVFTLTGSDIPQEFKIQILTVTGKIVREITRQELGPLKIGRNITDYKWDGTDQFGQKLANGVYLYRVVTSLQGKTLEKFNSKNESENTDKYFNKGYGKMYLMR